MKHRMFIIMGMLVLGLLATACGSDATAVPADAATPTTGPVATPTATALTEEKTVTAPTATPPASVDFAGKTITLLVMYSPGGGYDAIGRVVAAHLPRHLPGKPRIVVQNRPGAGGVIGTNYAYTAKPDGLTLAEFPTDIVVTQLVGAPGVAFDFQKFLYIGALQKATKACYYRTDRGIKTIQDMIDSPSPIFTGGSGGSSDVVLSGLLKEELGANITQVLGYQGTADTHIAIESGEVDGRCTTWSTVPASNPSWFETTPALVTPVIQFTIGGADKSMPDVPTIDSFRSQFSEKGWQTLLATIAPLQTYRTFAFPPGADDSMLAAYRKAFESMYNDSEFIAAMVRANRPLHGQNGAAVENILVNEIKVSQEVRDNIIRLLAAK